MGLGAQLTPPTVTIGPDDIPPTIEALPFPPLGTPDGTMETFHIRASGMVDDVELCLGGVSIDATMRDCNTNGIDDWFDIGNGTSADANENGIPDECETGDLNCDGAVNPFDIDPFVLALTSPGGYAAAYPNCNILNADCKRRRGRESISTSIRSLTSDGALVEGLEEPLPAGRGSESEENREPTFGERGHPTRLGSTATGAVRRSRGAGVLQ